MVIPRSFSSGALSIESKERSSERPFFARTVVIAAVRVVLAWSTCQIVPMFTLGFDLSNFSFAISVIYFRNNCPSISFKSSSAPVRQPVRFLNRATVVAASSGRRGSNPRPLAWKANALPTELLPQFSFLRRAPLPSFRGRRRPGGPCGRRWIRTTEVERQQIYSLPHLATLVSARYSNFKNLFPPTLSAPSRGPERRRRHRADGGIRTPDQLITNQLLWPTELHRQFTAF